MKKIMPKQAVFLFVLLVAFAVGFGQSRSVEAAPNFQFNATGVGMPGGCAQIRGVITNVGDEGATIRSAVLKIQIADAGGRVIWADVSNFNDVNIYIPAGGQITHQFNCWNDNCPSYNGQVRYSVDYRFNW